MVEKQILSGCACCGISRRHFLAAGCAACAGAAGLALPVRRVYGAGNSSKGTLRVLFALHAETQPGPDWPNVGFEFRPVMDRLKTTHFLRDLNGEVFLSQYDAWKSLAATGPAAKAG